MAFKKNQSGNINGRPKGALGKKTKVWNELGDYLTSEGALKYLQILKQLDDKNFMDRYEALLEYFKPKVQRSNIKQEDTKQIIVVRLIDS